MLRSLPVHLTIRLLGIFALCFVITVVIAILNGSTPLPVIVIRAVGIALSMAVLLWLNRLDKRSPEASGLRVKNVWRGLLLGLIVGVGLYTLVILVAALLGVYEIESINANIPALLGSFATLAVAATYEELLYRGILLQGLEAGFGSWLAVLLSAIFFGLLHATNPGATLVSTLSVSLAGVAFGLAFLKYRDLWLLSSIHLGWNFSQGPIYGVAASGNEFSSLINSTRPSLFNGRRLWF